MRTHRIEPVRCERPLSDVQRVWIVVLTALLACAAACRRAPCRPAGPRRPPRRGRAARSGSTAAMPTNGSRSPATGPLTTGDRIATDNGARAEITLGTTTLRLDAATELEIARARRRRCSVRLHGGSVAARAARSAVAGEFEMVTDEGRFAPQTAAAIASIASSRQRPHRRKTARPIFEGRDSALAVTPASTRSSGSTPAARRSTAWASRCATRSPAGTTSATAR